MMMMMMMTMKMLAAYGQSEYGRFSVDKIE
jgi:hypothetical protein